MRIVEEFTEIYLNKMIKDRNEQNNAKENKAGLHVANSLWSDKVISIQDNYPERLNQNFYASVYQVSFKEDQT